MDHSEALQQMAAERYLMDELTPEAREAFEAHYFECPECALDLRAGALFQKEAKALLPELKGDSAARAVSRPVEPRIKREWWAGWLRPAFALPVFATLLLVVGYQNLVTYPSLRASANEPRLLPWTPLRGTTRGGAQGAITADRRHGVALPIDLPAQASAGAYASYAFDLYDPQGKLAWSGAAEATADEAGESRRLLLVIPGAMLKDGAYTLAISGVASHGERTEIDRDIFNLHLNN